MCRVASLPTSSARYSKLRESEWFYVWRDVQGVEAILEFGGDLDEVVVIEFNIVAALMDGSDIDFAIGEAEVVGGAFVEIAPDAKGL